MKKKWYEFMLWIAYAAMIGVCIFLNSTSSFKEDTANVIVNVVLFIIVGITFLWADCGCFAKINTIIYDLNKATQKIRSDAMNSHTYLWDPYSRGNVELFGSKTLSSLFQDYVFELNRKPDAQFSYYRPSIDDYINDDLVDTTIHRNEMNQISGMLTGLGILGTFIGLSLGLQNFNTGTTAEMANSIEPLMNGIKVAFHTSIYGMVFSLVFNLIYKKKLYEADFAVEKFTNSYKKYVLPDTTNDGMNQIIEFQREQLGAFEDMSMRISHELSNIITPQFDRLNETIESFEMLAAKEQTEAVGKIVDTFLAEMNKSLSGSFAQIYQSVNEQYQLQRNNAVIVQDIMNVAGGNFNNLAQINAETEKLISTLNQYSMSIQYMQNELKNSVDKFAQENSGIMESLRREEAVLNKQETAVTDFKMAIESLKAHSIDSNDMLTEALDNLKAAMDKLDSTISSRSFRRGR